MRIIDFRLVCPDVYRRNHRTELWIEPFTYAFIFSFPIFSRPSTRRAIQKQLLYKRVLVNDYIDMYGLF